MTDPRHPNASPAHAPAEDRPPAVGIFWLVAEDARPPVLLAEACTVASAEPYGDFLGHGGHYEHWEKLAAVGAGELRRRGLPTVPAWSEYEEWPRGRVVHHIPTGRFVVYADPQLQRPATMSLIVRRFGLPADRFEVRGDPHYVSTRRVRSP